VTGTSRGGIFASSLTTHFGTLLLMMLSIRSTSDGQFSVAVLGGMSVEGDVGIASKLVEQSGRQL
jgi:hypothetical protein